MLDSSFVPITVLAFIIVCSATLIARGLLLPSEADADEAVFVDRLALVRPLVTFIVMASSYFVWEYFGFLIMSISTALVIAAIMNTRSVRVYAFLFVFGPAVSYVFTHLLGLQI